MPIPGSVVDGSFSLEAAKNTANLYPSFCTFYKPTYTKDTTGQEIRTYDVVDDSHTNVPCRKVPLVIVRGKRQEKMTDAFRATDEEWQVSLPVYFSDLDKNWLILVDGKMYRIMGLDADGNLKGNRVVLGLTIPFNL